MTDDLKALPPEMRRELEDAARPAFSWTRGMEEAPTVDLSSAPAPQWGRPLPKREIVFTEEELAMSWDEWLEHERKR